MSNKAWFKKRLEDPYLKKAQQEGYRSRAAYKLEEIDKKYKLIKPGQKILDAGAAPGSWCEYAINKTKQKATIIAIDLLEIEPIKNVKIIKGDICDKNKQSQIKELAAGKLDLILSDMAPDTTGIHHADTESSTQLVHTLLDLAQLTLKNKGSFVAKVFEGAEYSQLLKRAKQMFTFAKSFSPKASLKQSRELYLVAIDFKEQDALNQYN